MAMHGMLIFFDTCSVLVSVRQLSFKTPKKFAIIAKWEVLGQLKQCEQARADVKSRRPSLRQRVV
jgi:hypothetical protein